jgi:hypothetical protein
MSGMRSEMEAPRWRQALSGATDAAIAAGVGWGVRRARRVPVGTSARWLRPLGPSSELAREQLGSPGQRLLGLRTVDRRTGRRVEPWRSCVLFAIAVAGEMILVRLRPPADTPEQKRERERFGHEMRALLERHPQGSPELAAEQDALFERYGSGLPNHLSAMPAAIALTIAVRRLRRHLAPTTEILAALRSHSP